jgi:transcriptional regulator with XRE-family HTH domain
MLDHLHKNYLRSCRKRLGLTQKQLAFIVCLESGSRISALENGHVVPTAGELIVFRKLFARSVDELWPSWAAEVERDTGLRIEQLLDRLNETSQRSGRKQRRLEFTRRRLLASLESSKD